MQPAQGHTVGNWAGIWDQPCLTTKPLNQTVVELLVLCRCDKFTLRATGRWSVGGYHYFLRQVTVAQHGGRRKTWERGQEAVRGLGDSEDNMREQRGGSLKVNPGQDVGPPLNSKERAVQGAGKGPLPRPTPQCPTSLTPAHTYLLLKTLL